MKNALAFIFLNLFQHLLFAQPLEVSGRITDEKGKALSRAHVQILELDKFTVSSGHGFFEFELENTGNFTIVTSYVGMENDTQNILLTSQKTSIELNIVLRLLPETLDGVTITGTSKPDTVFGTQKVHVENFAFLPQNRLLLLTTTHNLKRQAEIWITNDQQEKIKSFPLTFEPTEVFQSFDNTCYVLGKKNAVAVKFQNKQILFSKVATEKVKSEIQPIVDTLSNTYLLSDFRWYFPKFSYYKWEEGQKESTPMYTVQDEDMYDLFMSEYTWLKPADKVEARKLAQAMEMDKYEVAAFLSGFMNSMYFEELYAPAFIQNDSLVVFDHHSNQILKKHIYHERGDSTSIEYNSKKTHQQKWEKKILFDQELEVYYTITSKNGFYYLRPINTTSGKTVGYYKLANKYPSHIQVKNGYVYYIYRPYGSIQKQYLYKEKIL